MFEDLRYRCQLNKIEVIWRGVFFFCVKSEIYKRDMLEDQQADLCDV